MRIAVSGYVSAQDGSVASANALLLRSLLDDGHEVDFFSKPSFVDPRRCIDAAERFRFICTDNVGPDRFRAKVQRVPILGFLACRFDCATYTRLLLNNIRREHQTRPYDVCLWLGDYVPGRVKNLPTISFAQGPPGTDARSIVARFDEVRRLAGSKRALQWLMLAKLRLSSVGLPPLKHSDHIIVGSQQSKRMLQKIYSVEPSRISTLPYPIDLSMFHPSETPAHSHDELRVLWLGRIIPRKRLDIFLNGLELAIRGGLNVKASIVGGVGFVPGYEKVIKDFPFPQRLNWITSLPRTQVPTLMHEHDLLVQPSDEENFGSSVAEAQACGLPVIVGCTNGNADFLCSRDIHLADDNPRTLAAALIQMDEHKKRSTAESWRESRNIAENNFALAGIAKRLEGLLERVADSRLGLRNLCSDAAMKTVSIPTAALKRTASETLL